MTRWLARWLIVLITGLWLLWEIWSNFDTDRSTWPLTWVIRQYLPPVVYFPLIVILAGWLVWHFWPTRGRPLDDPANSPEGIMTLPSSPVHVKRDALIRAVRSFVGGLVVTLVGAVGAGLVAAVSDGVRWTPEYPKAVLASVAGSVVLAVTSYVMRYTNPPKNA